MHSSEDFFPERLAICVCQTIAYLGDDFFSIICALIFSSIMRFAYFIAYFPGRV